MDNLDLAKQIYKEIYQAIAEVSKKHNAYCSLPGSIEFDGVIYFAGICDEDYDAHIEELDKRVDGFKEGKIRFYRGPISE